MLAYAQEVFDQDGVAIVRVRGHLDAHTAPQLEEALEGLFERSSFKVVLDLEELGYISSAGLGVLTGTLGTFRERGGDLKLAATPDNAFRVLDLLGFTQLLDLYDTRSAAIDSFKAS